MRQKAMDNLYFVDSIYQQSGASVFLVRLLKADNEEKTDGEIEAITLMEIPTEMANNKVAKLPIREGQYVYYTSKDDGQPIFENGSRSSFARRIYQEYNALRDVLIGRHIREEEINAHNYEGAKVLSYHVNVGHGNCSLIFITNGLFYELWMVDCSIRDIARRRSINHTVDFFILDWNNRKVTMI